MRVAADVICCYVKPDSTVFSFASAWGGNLRCRHLALYLASDESSFGQCPPNSAQAVARVPFSIFCMVRILVDQVAGCFLRCQICCSDFFLGACMEQRRYVYLLFDFLNNDSQLTCQDKLIFSRVQLFTSHIFFEMFFMQA